MCPHECPGLPDVWGDAFNALYTKYEKEGRMRKVVKARELWSAILDAQTETGTPYMLYKDACNRKSNQQNLGTIRCSNLCSEILEFTSPDEIAVCNLASIALPMFVNEGQFDHQKLFEVTQVVTRNLNKIIDINYYPVKEAETSNLRHRPIGIGVCCGVCFALSGPSLILAGVQGLADAFILLRLPFESAEARTLNKEIFETIYFAALTASKVTWAYACGYGWVFLLQDLAKKLGPYASYPGSPISQGVLQCDFWGVKPSPRWDWASLRAEIGNDIYLFAF